MEARSQEQTQGNTKTQLLTSGAEQWLTEEGIQEDAPHSTGQCSTDRKQGWGRRELPWLEAQRLHQPVSAETPTSSPLPVLSVMPADTATLIYCSPPSVSSTEKDVFFQHRMEHWGQGGSDNGVISTIFMSSSHTPLHVLSGYHAVTCIMHCSILSSFTEIHYEKKRSNLHKIVLMLK